MTHESKEKIEKAKHNLLAAAEELERQAGFLKGIVIVLEGKEEFSNHELTVVGMSGAYLASKIRETSDEVYTAIEMFI